MTIIMVHHDINQAINYSDEIIAMKDGKILFQGVPEEVITSASLKSDNVADNDPHIKPDAGPKTIPQIITIAVTGLKLGVNIKIVLETTVRAIIVAKTTTSLILGLLFSYLK